MKALITGATSGIGEALAKLLATKGIALVLTGRNETKLKELVSELSKQVSCDSVVADLLLKEQRGKIVRYLQEHPVDLLINNAGFGFYGPAVSQSTNDLLDILELDAASVLELTVEQARILKASKRKGIIMNISSAAAFHIIPNLAVYSAAKAFVNSFSQTLDFELKGTDIRVLVACPGKVATQFSSRASGGKTKPIEPGGTVMSASFAASEIWNQIVNEKPLRIFDWKYRLSTFFSYLFPRSWSASIAKRFMKDKRA